MTMSFVPRMILSIKPYRVKVGPGDSPRKIAVRFGVGEAGYSELAAANLPREVFTLARGGPKTIVLEEEEWLNIPSHWPDPPQVTSQLGDALGTPEMNTTNPVFVAAAAAASKAGISDQNELAADLNAVVQWYTNVADLTKPIDTGLMDTMTVRASEWYALFGTALTPAQSSTFPWAPLPQFFGGSAWDIDFAKLDWNADIPGGPAGLTWSLVPWALLGDMGGKLETAPIPAIQVPAQLDQASVQAAFQASINQAFPVVAGQGDQLPPGASCPDPAYPYFLASAGICVATPGGQGAGPDPTCADPNTAWSFPPGTCEATGCDGTLQGKTSIGPDGKPIPMVMQGGNCVSICPDPTMTWDDTDKSCVCPSGKVVDQAAPHMCIVGTTTTTPTPAAIAKSLVVPVIATGAVLTGLYYGWKYLQSRQKKE